MAIETSTFQAIKLVILSFTGLEKDALHIYVGLGVFLGYAALFKKPLRSIGPVLAAFLVAICGELLDIRDDIASLGYWRWRASIHDIINTQFWPTVLFLLARFSRLLGHFNDR
jgi:hypothetical protein